MNSAADFLGFAPLVPAVLAAARAAITFPNVVSDLLMFAPSLSLCPVAPVEFARSEPARSTRLYILQLCSRIVRMTGCLQTYLILETFSPAIWVSGSILFWVSSTVKTE